MIRCRAWSILNGPTLLAQFCRFTRGEAKLDAARLHNTSWDTLAANGYAVVPVEIKVVEDAPKPRKKAT